MDQRTDWRKPLKEVVVYVEGGGPGVSRTDLRLGLQNGLFDSLRRIGASNGVALSFIACKGRDQTIDRFSIAVRTEPCHSLLLIDSEGPVVTSSREHLAGQGKTHAPAEDSQLHLMVQAIEAWFLADSAALQVHFGSKVAASKRDVETIPKDQLKPTLDSIAANTPKKRYSESRDQRPLLEQLNPETVMAKSRHFERLFRELESLVSTP